MIRRPRALLAAAAVMAACLGTACRGAPGTPAATLDRMRAAGVARVGYANEAPFAYRDTETDELTGEAPAIARVVLGRLGVPDVEGVLTEFGSLIPGLQAGRFDLIAAGMYIRPERCAQVAFSNPTYSIGEAFIVPAGNPLDLHGYDDVRTREEATLGVVAGAIERTYAREVGIPDARIATFPDPPSALAAVRAGRVSAYGATGLTAQTLLDKGAEGLERAEPFRDPVVNGDTVRGYGAFAFRKADADLLAAFNRELGTFIGSDAHRALVEPFGFTRAELPGGVTAATLCADD